MAMMARHWALKGFGHWVLEERESGELVGRAGLYYPPDWPALEVGWTVAPRRTGARAMRARPARAACDWAHDELGAAHRQPDPPRERAVASAWRRSSARRSRAGTARRGFDLLVYGADLPLQRFAALTRGYTAAHDDERRDARRPAGARGGGRRRRRGRAASAGARPSTRTRRATRPSEAERALIEGGEGVEEGFETGRERPARGRHPRREPLRPRDRTTSATRRAPATATPCHGEPDEIDVTETSRPRPAGEDPGEGPGIPREAGQTP